MKPVHLVLFLRALKSPNTDEAVGQTETKVTVCVVRLLSFASREWSRVSGWHVVSTGYVSAAS